jgi:hypothetical protein
VDANNIISRVDLKNWFREQINFSFFDIFSILSYQQQQNLSALLTFETHVEKKIKNSSEVTLKN